MTRILLIAVVSVLMTGCILRPGANGNVEACEEQAMNVSGAATTVLVCRDTGVPNSAAGW